MIFKMDTIRCNSLIELIRALPDEGSCVAYLVDKAIFDEKLDELGIFDAIEICGMYIERAMYNLKKTIQNWFRNLLELLFEAAALVIDTIRTFFLVVLAILGPISFAISVWDGFQASMTQWISRYLTVYLWLPVSDLFTPYSPGSKY